jgi:hypothetical protein
MTDRGLGSLAVVLLGSYPTPLPHQQVVSLSHSFSVSPGRANGRAEEPNNSTARKHGPL